MGCRWWLAWVFAAVAGAQELTVIGAPDHTVRLMAADLTKMPRTMITATEHGHEVKFEGVLLREVLKRVAAPLGDGLKGQNVPAFVYLSGRDGYHATIALAEVDSGVQENDILVADTANGKPLNADQGPFRLVVPEDNKPLRWVRMLERIEVRIPEGTPK